MPGFAPEIPHRWEFNANADRMARMAGSLVDARFLRPEHLPKTGTLFQAIESALKQFGDQARSTRLAQLSIVVTDSLDTFEVEYETYARDQKISPRKLFSGKPPLKQKFSDEQPDRLGAVILAQDYESIHIGIIGPALEILDAAMPRLGQSVLTILNNGLMSSCRALTPSYAHCWASNHYWMGEEDETSFLHEEMNNLVDDIQSTHKTNNPNLPELTYDQVVQRVKEQINLFTIADLEADIPREFWAANQKSLKSLPTKIHARGHQLPIKDVFWIEDAWPKILAACTKVKALARRDCRSDNGYSYQVSEHSVPFLLRMHDRDCMGRILDDRFNMEIEGGETEMDVNSFFLWHDAASLRRAFQRLENMLQLIQACEELITLLESK